MIKITQAPLFSW